LLRWLVDVQHCPIHVLSTGNIKSVSVTASVMGAGADMIKSLGASTETKHDFVPTLKTSKGRSVIDIAMKTQHVGILRYLINEKHVSVYEVEELELALGAVEALAKAFPVVDGTYDPKMFAEKKRVENGVNNSGISSNVDKRRSDNSGRERKNSATERVAAKSSTIQRSKTADTSPIKARIYSHTVVSPPKEKVLLPRDIHGVHEGVGLYGAIGGYDGNNDDSDGDSGDEEHDTILLEDDNSVCTTVPDICILCREKDVDCVATPCGHQMCCLTCSNQCLRCPICNLECHFIEIYQP